MLQTLARRYSMNRRNNFDLLRLLAATGVMALHLRDLSMSRALSFLGVLDPRISLATFFVISGFLVYMSYDKSPTLRSYLDKRLRRIVPAYVAVVLACALLGSLMSAWPYSAYFGRELVHYLLANLSFLNFLKPNLPGVFVDNPFPGAPVNGALWTIKVELMFYALVPVLVPLARRFGHRLVLGGGFLFGCLWWGGFVCLAEHTGKAGWGEVAKQMPGQLMYFLPGAWCYCERRHLSELGHWLGCLGIFLLVLATRCPPIGVTLGAFIYPLGLACCVSWAAFNLPYLGSFTRHGDLSYGVYLWHFPVIQALVQLGVFQATPLGGAALSMVLVAALAWLSWHAIEAPILRQTTFSQQKLQA